MRVAHQKVASSFSPRFSEWAHGIKMGNKALRNGKNEGANSMIMITCPSFHYGLLYS